MGLFDLFKSKKEIAEEGLTEQEQDRAFKAVEIAGIAMRFQFEKAILLGGADFKEEIIENSYAFAFGMLVASLDGQGIAWEKSPYASIKFVEAWMNDSGDHKDAARIMLHLGMEGKYSRFREAGMQAFIRFINDDEDLYRPMDFAYALGLRPVPKSMESNDFDKI